jgi:hypothetical protein
MKNATIAILADKTHLAALSVADKSAPQYMKVGSNRLAHQPTGLPRTEAGL